MNKNISKIVLSLSAILALSGCETESDYKASDNTTGLSGYVLGDTYISNAKVCMDTNENGICNTDENSVSTDENGYYEFSESVSSNNTDSLLIAEVKDDTSTKYVLSSNQNSIVSQNITPYTTLVVNEENYNLKVKNGDTTANAYLKTELSNVDDSLLDGSNYITSTSSSSRSISREYDATSALTNAKSLIGSYETAYELNASAPLLGIASVVDEVIKNDSYDVSISSVSSQEVSTGSDSNGTTTIEDEFSLTSLNQQVTWTKTHDDEIVIGATSSEDKVVSYSKWNNRLTILNTSDKTKKATSFADSKYLYVSGDKDTVDSVSSATEEKLEKVEISSDGNTIYSLLINGDTGADKTKKGLGIYKADISSKITSTPLARDNVSSNFYEDSSISDIALSTDASTLVANNSAGILIFDTSNFSSPTEVPTKGKVKSVAISDDKKYIFVGLTTGFKQTPSLGIYSVSTKGLLGEYTEIDAIPNKIEIGSNNDIFVASTAAKSVYHFDISDTSNITLKNTFSFNDNIKSIKESEDTKLLIVGTSGKEIVLRDVNNTSRSTKVTAQDVVTNAYSLTDDKIAVTAGRTLNYYSLINTPASISTDTIEAWENTYRK